jgi:DNA polymerase/3'-5' exonuclease PolX
MNGYHRDSISMLDATLADIAEELNRLYDQHSRLPIDVFYGLIEGFAAREKAKYITFKAFCAERTSLAEMPYGEYLQTEHWSSLRIAKLDEAGCRCQLCNAQGVTLNVHHRTYERRGKEELTDVIVLCQPCHAKFHDKLPRQIDG